MATHELKTWPGPFAATSRGEKTAEFRRDDRSPPFAVGDTLLLREWDPDKPEDPDWDRYTGNALLRRVTHVARDPRFGIPQGYCMMSLGGSPYDGPIRFFKPDVT